MKLFKIFKREKKEIQRLEDDELREFYLDVKTSEKRWNLTGAIMNGVITILFASLTFAGKVYWLIVLPILTLIGSIVSLNRYARNLHELVENRVIDKIKQGRSG